MESISQEEIASNDLKEKEKEAKEEAIKMIQNYLNRPDQLEQTEHLKKYITRQKGSVEAMLKSAFQSQLDGVKTGLNQLNCALKDIREVKQNLEEIKVHSRTVNDLQIKLKKIREESFRHSQLVSACDNVLHIYSVPETIKKCREYIEQSNLLHAHKGISDMESSRDDIMYELYRQENPREADKEMVELYFGELNDLVKKLANQLFLFLQRTIVSLRLEPTIIVTVIRIIEREEKLDEIVSKKYGQMKIKNRPKEWKKRAFKTMEEAVQSKIEGNLMEDRANNKMWLVRHLEIMRQTVLEDLKVIKTLCEPCFPPHYNIVPRYIDMYHNSISMHLNEIVDQGLEGNEIVSLLNWMNEYFTAELVGHPSLNIDVSSLNPLMTPDRIKQLNQQYIITLRSKMKEWMANSIKTDSKDWYKDQMPDTDDKGFYCTSLPVLLIQMIEQHIDVAKTIGNDLVISLVNMCLEEMKQFIDFYKSEVTNYDSIHHADRNHPKYYLHNIIANTNNCETLLDFLVQMQKRYVGGFKTNVIKELKEKFESLVELLIAFLLKDVFADLDPHIQDLLTKKWILSAQSVDTICMTIEDYCQDFVHLKNAFYDELLKRARLRCAKEFYRAILAKKIVFKSYEERFSASEKMIKETDQLKILFNKLIKDPKFKQKTPYDGFPNLIELIKLKDASMMTLEVSGFANHYPDIRIDMLVNVLMMRGDMLRSDAKQVVLDSLGEDHDFKISRVNKTIFSSLDKN